jgi:hypothetical protein
MVKVSDASSWVDEEVSGGTRQPTEHVIGLPAVAPANCLELGLVQPSRLCNCNFLFLMLHRIDVHISLKCSRREFQKRSHRPRDILVLLF